MIVLRNPADVAAIKHPGIHRLIRERLAEMKLDEPYNQFGELVVVESGDKPGGIESSCGCWITTGLFGVKQHLPSNGRFPAHSRPFWPSGRMSAVAHQHLFQVRPPMSAD